MLSVAEGDRLLHLELVAAARRELGEAARPLRHPVGIVAPSERAELETVAGAPHDLIVGAEAAGPDGLDLVDFVGMERGVADPVPPGLQHDVLHGKLGNPCLLDNRTRSTRVVDLVTQRHRQLIVVH